MSGLHTYRLLHVDLRTGLHTGRALERAFSAADAVTQFRAKNPAESVGPVFEIEPLPDTPTRPGRLPKDGELVAIDGRVFSVRLVPLSGATEPRPTIAEIERALNTPTAPENVPAQEGLKPTPLDESKPLALADRIEALEAALRERTEERDCIQRRLDSAESRRDMLEDAASRIVKIVFDSTQAPIIPLDAMLHEISELKKNHREARGTMEEAVRQRDALQKRIDAARDRVRFVADSDDRDRLASILEGRETQVGESTAHGAAGRTGAGVSVTTIRDTRDET